MSSPTRFSERLSRRAGIASALWGTTLLAAGRDLWYVLDGHRPGAVDEAAVRFLGTRHLTQGTLQATMPTRFQRLYVAVDVTHAASMFWLAAVDERRRRPALVSGAAALASAAVTLAARRSQATRAPGASADASRPGDAGSRPRAPADGT
jgi:hypothetical protein